MLKKSQTFIVLLTNQLVPGRKAPLRNCTTFPSGVWCIGGKDGWMWKTSCPSLKNCEQVLGSFPLLVTLCMWWTSKNTTLFWNPGCLGLTLWKFMSDVCVCIFVKWLVLWIDLTKGLYIYEKSFEMWVCLWPEFHCPEVTLCGWQDVKIQLLTILVVSFLLCLSHVTTVFKKKKWYIFVCVLRWQNVWCCFFCQVMTWFIFSVSSASIIQQSLHHYLFPFCHYDWNCSAKQSYSHMYIPPSPILLPPPKRKKKRESIWMWMKYVYNPPSIHHHHHQITRWSLSWDDLVRLTGCWRI